MWLHRIVTNACLRMVERRPPRVLPIDYDGAADPHGTLAAPLVESTWIEPYPDDQLPRSWTSSASGRSAPAGASESFPTRANGHLAFGYYGLKEDRFVPHARDIELVDATDPTVAGDVNVIYARDPDILAVVAGVTPLLHPIHHHTWETFSLPWDVDVRIALPKLTPATGLGLAAVRGYAARRGVSEEQFRQALGARVTPEIAGAAFVSLAAGELDGSVAYAPTSDGLSELPVAP